MGTDNLGRDIFSRVVYGARVSVSVGFGAVLLANFLATIIGSPAATSAASTTSAYSAWWTPGSRSRSSSSSCPSWRSSGRGC
jgi:ABC-type dipeptide/oligopeptide/nickel transport system permease subunit